MLRFVTQLKSARARIFAAVGALVIVVFVVALVERIATAISRARVYRRIDIGCRHMDVVGIALSQYWKDYNRFPPAYTLGPDERPWHSWRVLLLPYLHQDELYAEYRFDEPWDGPHNRELQHRCPAAYSCPICEPKNDSITNYFAIVSRRSAWPAYFSCRYGKDSDFFGSYLQVGTCESDVIWTEPRDLSEDEVVRRSAKVVEESLAKKPTDDMMFNQGRTSSVRLSAPILRARNKEFDLDWYQRLVRSKITVSFNRNVIDNDSWPPTLLVDKPPCEKTPFKSRPSESFKATRVVSSIDLPLNADQNVLHVPLIRKTPKRHWAASNQNRVGVETEPAAKLGSLISESIPKEIFDILVVDSHEEMSSAVLRELSEAFPETWPTAASMSEQMILLWLRLPLSLPEGMPLFDSSLRFPATEGGLLVESFGSVAIPHPPDFHPGSSRERVKFQPSIDICHYVSDDDFVLRLISTAGPGLEVILAKITPDATFARTWDQVAVRAKKRFDPLDDGKLREIDELRIPVISFGLANSDRALSGAEDVKDGNSTNDVARCKEAIQLRLDGCGSVVPPDEFEDHYDGVPQRYNEAPARRLIFDKPFLMAVRVWQTDEPFFLAWIANAELMSEVGKSSTATPNPQP